MAVTLNANTSTGFIATSDTSGVLQLQTAGTTAVTVDASQRTAFVAGTAALPAITTTGDTNTGIYFPAADTIAFSEGGVESARIDASGNMGLGVTPAAWVSTFKALQVGTSAAMWSTASGVAGTYISNNNFFNGTNRIYLGTGTAAEYAQVSGSHQWSTAASGTAGNTVSFTQAMTLDASGNLLVGRTNTTVSNNIGTIIAPTFTSIAGNSNGTLFLRNCSPTVSADIGGLIRFDAVYRNSDSDTTDIAGIAGLRENATNANYAGYLAFSTTPNGGSRTERARITSGGDFAIGKTQASETPSTGSGFGFAAAAADPFFSIVNANVSAGNANIYLSKRTTGVIVSINTNNGTTNTSVGSISTAASSTAYNTSSDYRLKHDIAPMTGALSRVATLKPVTYKWNVDNSDGEGFIAHELAEVCPQAVSGEKDAVNEDGSINPQGIDTSFLVATLTAAIQEQQAIIQTLTDRITALEGTTP